MNHKIYIFIICYIIFSLVDFKYKKINIILFLIYLFVGLIINLYDINNTAIINILKSSGVGILIYIISLLTREQIGKGDAIYMTINGLYLSFKENLILLLSGLFVSFLISIFIILSGNGKNKSIPFIPCFLPFVIGVILCM